MSKETMTKQEAQQRIAMILQNLKDAQVSPFRKEQWQRQKRDAFRRIKQLKVFIK